MIPVMPPVPLIRRNYIIRKLLKSGAVSEEHAVSFKEAGIFNPKGFPVITRRLLKQGIIKTSDGVRYYLDTRVKRKRC